MRLKIKNIGMIKSADIKLNGLTVIAGENDTGKSTASKVLYSIIKSISKNSTNISSLNLNNNFNTYFAREISQKGEILFETANQQLNIQIIDNECKIIDSISSHTFCISQCAVQKIIMIETPLIWNFVDLFTKLPMIEDNLEIELEYPQIMKDLHWNLSLKAKEKGIDISKIISEIIHGQFLKNSTGNFHFQKGTQEIKLLNTATGIKYFGILETLSKNNHLHKNQILILDEPEVHLHPKWQLKLAKVISYLSKEGVKIIVNSHSPYMIEALQRYTQNSNSTNFYLAENANIEQINSNNADTLAKIFEKLSEPFEIFDKMDSDELQNG